MRIVMVTPDIQIDRRILHEAETLIAAGYEVILLADGHPDQPSHEWVGRVKVERCSSAVPAPTRPERTILFFQRKLIGLVNRVSLLGQRLIGLVAAVMNRLLGWVATLFQKGITQLAGLINRAAQLAIRGVNALAPLTGYEALLARRAIYYDPDVVHVHDLPVLRVGVAVRRQLRIPLVYDAHEIYPAIRTLTARQKQTLFQREKRLTPECAQVITVNSYLAKEMAHNYRIPTPTVIWNAIQPPPNFDPRDHHNLFRQELAIPDHHLILLYQGWFSPDRGLQILLEGFARTREDIHLVMMGYGEFGQALQDAAQDLGVTHRVHFKAAVPQDELLFWTASADAGVIPYPPLDSNTRFCSPNKLFEFIQAHLPILANDLPFLREVVGRENFGVVLPLENSDDITRGIELIFDPALGGAARFKASLQSGAARYHWSVQAETLRRVYSGLQPAPVQLD
jgi:glycosyltransferase involved in cell wall biosynthesis